MGFMDKAKRLAEQAQQKLDEQPSASSERRPSSPEPAPAAPQAPPPPAPSPPLASSAEAAERIAPPALTSGDPLRRA